MSTEIHCPFAKALFLGCCTCPHAEFYDQRTRRVNCTRALDLRADCEALDEILIATAQALPELETVDSDLSYGQLIKTRCGGLHGLHRLLSMEHQTTPLVPEIIATIKEQYGEISNFPFNSLNNDITTFNVRKRKR